jgi:tetratricopeptide (TPR) repeat protein/TolB-like protein
VLSSILKDSPRPASELRDEIPRPLARMIQRALEKRPEDRYQSTTDLRRDLEDLKRDVDTGDVPLRSSTIRRRLLPASSKRGLALKLATAAALVVLVGMVAVFSGGRTPADAGDGRRSLAVLYFDNIAGEPGLDWLRTGLTDMLVTNLSQTPGLRVLSTQRLYQILAEAGHKDDRATTGDAVAAVARESQATTAVVGSYVRAGSRIRIQASLQDPRTGETIASERVEGDADQGLFALVDELTTRIRKRLETPSMPRLASDYKKKLHEVTTSSVEAYKAYAEGSRLHERQQEREALGYFEKAVEADPGFAMALAKLSVVSANLGDMEKARIYSARAVEHAKHLPPGERYYIEGRHYSLDPRTTEKAVAAYEKAVDEAPDHTAARNNLAQTLIELKRYPEALVHLEELRRRGMSFPGSYSSLAETYVATGQIDKAREALTGYVAEHPDSAAGLENLGFFELVQGNTDDALAAFERAATLGPDEKMKIEMGRATAHALRDEWGEVAGCAKRLAASSDPRERWSGGATLAIASLYRGDVGEARRLAMLGAKTGETPYERVAARLFHARLEADLGSHKAALAQAERAAAESGDEPKLRAEGYAMKAICLEKLGRHDDAKRSAAEVEGFLASLPKVIAEPARLQLEGEMALARGDHDVARHALDKAAELLPERATSLDHGSVEVDYARAQAALAAGDEDAAREALERVTGSGPKRVGAPVPYVRSLALLAELEEKQGRVAEARKLYERYLRYWKHGQIDRAEVARAGQRLAVLRSKAAA